MHHDEQELLLWEGWHSDDNKGGWLDPELCAEARREEVEHIRRQKLYTRVTREVCLRDWEGTHQEMMGGDRQGCARGGSRWNTRHTQGRYASTAPLEALEVVLSEVSTGQRGGNVVALVDVRSRPKITRQVMNTCAGSCNAGGTARTKSHKIGRKSLHRHSAISS